MKMSKSEEKLAKRTLEWIMDWYIDLRYEYRGDELTIDRLERYLRMMKHEIDGLLEEIKNLEQKEESKI
uniref:Uncharacterized protein n=1 Tax=candidate division WOR-3 bacterium TaxID=2052148 RepID=A0A7V4E1Z9_UNCW3